MIVNVINFLESKKRHVIIKLFMFYFHNMLMQYLYTIGECVLYARVLVWVFVCVCVFFLFNS